MTKRILPSAFVISAATEFLAKTYHEKHNQSLGSLRTSTTEAQLNMCMTFYQFNYSNYNITSEKSDEERGAKMSNNFHGFSKKTTDFFLELQFCNTLEKQEENLARYKEDVSIPLNQLHLDLSETVKKFRVKFEIRPARCVSTPYTDRRFSPNAPIKDYMYLRFRQSNKKIDRFCLFFDMSSEVYRFGLQIYKPTSYGMDVLRKRVGGHAKLFSDAIDKIIDKGFVITGAKYKRDYYPDVPDCSAREILDRSGFTITKTKALNESIYSSDLAVELSTAFLDLKEFVELSTK